MALFRTNPEKNLVAAVAARDKVKIRLGDAEAAVSVAALAAQQLALAGADDDALDKAESKVRAATDRTVRFRNALVEAEAAVASLEADRDAAADAKLRRETAAECEKMATDLEAVAASFDTAITGLAAISERAATFIFEASGLSVYAVASKTQVPDAAAIIAAMLRQHGLAVINGDAPATLRAPDVAEAVVETPAAPTILLFALRPIKWIAADGTKCAAQKFTDAALTETAASRGLAMGALVALDSPLRKQHHGTAPGHVRVDLALDLDADEPARVPIEPASPFTVVDRGGAIQMKVARS